MFVMRYYVAICLALALIATPSVLAKGKLSAVRKEVDDEEEEKKPASKSSSSSKPSKAKRWYPYSSCDDDDEPLFGITLNFGSNRDNRPRRAERRSPGHRFEYDPNWAPNPIQYVSNESPDSRTGTAAVKFAHYPYADGHDGYLFYDQENIRAEQQGASIQFHYGADFDGLGWWTGKLLWETVDRWNIDGEWSFFQEDLGATTDSLHVGDVNLMFRVGETERWQSYFGLGMNWINDSVVTDVGINGSLRFNFFPARPVIFSSEVDYGTLGSTDQLHLAMSVGLIWSHLELFSGYDHRRIGQTVLSGPAFGLRYWW